MTRALLRVSEAALVVCARAVAVLFVAAVAHLLVIPISTAHASVGDAMQTYFDDMGAAANVTGPSAFEGQSAGYYTLGNVWTRFPQKNSNVANLQLPSARGGCGGIDIFAGSFSFINAGEIVALLKAVANNAVGFAFQLAVDTVCPECGSVMKDFAQKVQLMNNMTINSCETAQGLVGAVWPKSDLADKQICEVIGNSTGVFSDAAAAKHGCGSKGERRSTLEGASADFEEVNSGLPRNYTWHVLKRSAFFAPGGVIDRELAEYVMTLVGTVIYVPGGDSAPGSYAEFTDPADPALITAIIDGTDSGPAVKILKCDEPDLCLNPTYQTLSVSVAQAIRPRVRAMIADMMDAILEDTAITAAQQNLLQVASIPLYKMLAVQAAYSRGLGAHQLDVLAEVSSLDLVFSILDRLMAEARRSGATFIGADETKLARWTAGMQSAKQTLLDRQGLTQNKIQAVLALVEQTAFLESTLQSSMSPSMAAALDWSRGVRSGSLN